jgi:hypothetical protein
MQDQCFVAMPFDVNGYEYYSKIFSPAITDAGLTAVRADEGSPAGSVLKFIVDLISKSKIVVADISENNRNVHYELGVAHALGKPTVLIAPQNTNIFFDVIQERTIKYNKDEASWESKLRTELAGMLKATMRDPGSAVPTAFMYIKPTRHAADEATIRLRRIEEYLSELLRASGSAAFLGRMQGLMKSEAAAQAEAERLLASMTADKVLEQLQIMGFGVAMAESALAMAQAKRHAATRN